jgi:hypothetical protein
VVRSSGGPTYRDVRGRWCLDHEPTRCPLAWNTEPSTNAGPSLVPANARVHPIIGRIVRSNRHVQA